MPKSLLLFLIPLTIVTGPMAHAQSGRLIDDAALKNAAKNGEEWTTYGFTQGETRYSPLNQINTSNVSEAWPGVVL